MQGLFKSILLISILVSGLFSEGRIEDRSFYSPATGSIRSLRVYLPEAYDLPGDTTDYPVVVFLHGGYVSPQSYPMLFDALDTLIWTEAGPLPEGRIQPMIAVLPNGNEGEFGGMTWWTNSSLNGDFADYVAEDVLAFASGLFRIDPNPEQHFIMGHSMGGYGALSLALTHPTAFRAVSTLGGVVDLSTTLTGITPWVLEENAEEQPLTPSAGVWSEILFSMAGAFSPNPLILPWGVELPIDGEGVRDSLVWQQWRNHDPARLAATLDPSANLHIYLQCGVQDLLWIEVNRALSDSLTAMGINHRFDEFQGGHNDALGERFPFALLAFDSLLRLDPLDLKTLHQPLTDDMLIRAYPNPFNAQTRIHIELDQQAPVSIDVFDVAGRHVENLFSGILPAGGHQLEWRPRAAATGIYLLHITQGRHSQTRRLVILN